MFKLRKLVIFY